MMKWHGRGGLALLLALLCLLPLAARAEWDEGHAWLFDSGMPLRGLLDMGVTLVNNEARYMEKPLHGVYLNEREGAYTLSPDVTAPDPEAAYALAVYEEHTVGEPVGLLPISYEAFCGYLGNAARWLAGDTQNHELYGLDIAADIVPDETFTATYKGERVLGIADDRIGTYDYRPGYVEADPVTGIEPDYTLLTDGVFLKITTTVEVIDAPTFESIDSSAETRLRTPSVGDGEYMRFGLIGAIYDGKAVMGFYDEARHVWWSYLTLDEREGGMVNETVPTTFLVANRDADGMLTGLQEISLDEFVAIYDEVGVIGNG